MTWIVGFAIDMIGNAYVMIAGIWCGMGWQWLFPTGQFGLETGEYRHWPDNCSGVSGDHVL